MMAAKRDVPPSVVGSLLNQQYGPFLATFGHKWLIACVPNFHKGRFVNSFTLIPEQLQAILHAVYV
jgi:hypothetical protein